MENLLIQHLRLGETFGSFPYQGHVEEGCLLRREEGGEAGGGG